ncbi:atp synthase gamma-related [Anaeramoeba flamelloides]|uniref:Atp synthase gamma-related n=1 Tax=Anaeramoeba flamelloides TaxID=1746091 RepID=A0ABQ8XY61_9EUKA|nr:atp synthase gamma-related [Anaeramoeba flamelloides]
MFITEFISIEKLYKQNNNKNSNNNNNIDDDDDDDDDDDENNNNNDDDERNNCQIVKIKEIEILEFKKNIEKAQINYEKTIIYTINPKLIRNKIRSFLFNKTKFYQLFKINENLKELIHYQYRLRFLKNHIIYPIIEDNIFANLLKIINQTDVLILKELQKTKDFFQVLNKLFENSKIGSIERKLFFLFFFELIKMSKISTDFQITIFRQLSLEKIYSIIQQALLNSNNKIQIRAVETLFEMVNQSPKQFRNYLISEEQEKMDYSFFKTLLQTIAKDKIKMNVKYLLINLLRSIFDLQSFMSEEKINFSNIFFNNFLSELLNPIMKLGNLENKNNNKLQIIFEREREGEREGEKEFQISIEDSQESIQLNIDEEDELISENESDGEEVFYKEVGQDKNKAKDKNKNIETQTPKKNKLTRCGTLVLFEENIETINEENDHLEEKIKNRNLLVLNKKKNKKIDLNNQVIDLIFDFLKDLLENFRIKMIRYILDYDLIENFLILLFSNIKEIQLSFLRFLKTFILLSDLECIKYLKNKKIFLPLFECVKEIKNVDNMFNSCLLNLFQQIKNTNNKLVLQFLIEDYKDEIMKLSTNNNNNNNNNIFEELIELNEKNENAELIDINKDDNQNNFDKNFGFPQNSLIDYNLILSKNFFNYYSDNYSLNGFNGNSGSDGNLIAKVDGKEKNELLNDEDIDDDNNNNNNNSGSGDNSNNKKKNINKYLSKIQNSERKRNFNYFLENDEENGFLKVENHSKNSNHKNVDFKLSNLTGNDKK